MDLKEACDLFGLPKTASDIEFKAKHKSFIKQYHPDIYKEDPNKLSKINQAYDVIKDYKANPNKYDNPNPFGSGNPFSGNPFQGGFGFNIQDIFDFGQPKKTKRSFRQPVSMNIDITFEESILGLEKELSYQRFFKCNSCNGVGENHQKNDCNKCDGFGKVVSRQGNMITQSMCGSCFGKNTKTIKCNNCNSEGSIIKDHNVKVSIPAGVKNDTLRMHNAGHYVGSDIFQGDLYSDVMLHIKVAKDPDMSLVDNNVVSALKISLLDALTGCDKEVKTVYGKKTITIPPKSKHKEEVRIKNCGVRNSGGDHVVEIFTEYPNDVKELIELLKTKEN